jgi:hypothetical protein
MQRYPFNACNFVNNDVVHLRGARGFNDMTVYRDSESDFQSIVCSSDEPESLFVEVDWYYRTVFIAFPSRQHRRRVLEQVPFIKQIERELPEWW